MGSFESKNSVIGQDDGVYRVKSKDTAVMKKVWQIVEYDLSYYGAIFSTILFRNHPQYVKYFQEDNIPEFVQDARIKKKFSAVCTVVSALFIDYSKKRRQRDHLLGYIAMVHKDMQLSSQDFENFMMDLLETLIQELPEQMTAECTVVHVRYFSGLLRRIGYFMQLQNEKDFELLERFENPSKNKKFCGWLSLCDHPSIYGRPLEHWILKKQYWQIKTAFWASVEMEMSGMSSFLSMEKDNHNQTKKNLKKCPPSELLSDNNGINSWSKPIEHFEILTTSSKSVSAESTHKLSDQPTLPKNVKNNSHSRKCSWYEKCKKNRKNRRTNSAILTPLKPMETIKEDQSKGLIGQSAKKASKTYVDPTKIQGDLIIHSDAQKTSSDLAIKNRKDLIVDGGRARKRRRDKRNVVHPTTRI